MSDSDGYTGDDPLVLPARLVRREAYSPWWSGLLGPVQTLVAVLPSHKSTRKGRRKARHFRLIVGTILLVGIVFSPAPWMAIAAIVLFTLTVPWLPLPEVRKRGWSNRLGTLQGDQKRTVTRPARIVYDGRRVKLDKGGNTLRRVLTDREDHVYRVGLADDHPYINIAPESGNKSEGIWVGTDELDPETLDDLDLRDFDGDQLDRPALVTADDWRKLLSVLRSLEP
jgi:hypothetical protein